MTWQDISTLPEPPDRPGRVFVVVEGFQYHSGCRASYGIARTRGEGFNFVDIAAIEKADSMDPGTGRVTHWMKINLPACPQFVRS